MDNRKPVRFLALTAISLIVSASQPAEVFAALPGDEEMSQAAQAESAGDYASAEKKYQESIEKFKESKRNFPLSFALDSLGNLYFQENALEKAAESYNRALDVRKSSLARGTDDSGAPLSPSARQTVQKDIGLAMVALGSVYTRQSKYEKAGSILATALSTIKAAFGPEHDCVGAALAAIGDLKFAKGSYAEARNYYRQALAIRRRYHAPNDPALAALVANNAAVQKILGGK